MAKVLATRGAQWPLIAEIVLNLATDSVMNTAGAEEALNVFAAHVFDGIKLPTGAIVVGGSVTTEIAATGSTAVNVSVGDSASATRYLSATDKVAAGRTALVPTGYVGLGEDIRITITPTVANATAGRISVQVEYIIRNRVNEVQTH